MTRMPDTPNESIRRRVVTFESLELPLESADAAARADADTRGAAALSYERYLQIRERLRQQSREVGDGLMITVPDREASLLQSALARDGSSETDLGAGAREVRFGTGVGGGDIFGWLKSLFDWVDRGQAHAILRPATSVPDPFPAQARIAMTADWGTGLYGAPKIGEQMTRMGVFDLLLHLGDVYYSGTREEEQARFLDVWPKAAGRISRALNSNHEMYSGGFGYFELALPALGQSASYFAFQNDHWLLVGLDTAYVDHDMDNQQVAWLNAVVRQAGSRKVVLFSHQQLFSRLGDQGPKLHRALRHLLESRAITAWYWGHEHQCVIYDAHPRYGLLGRCLGNGGIPEAREQVVKDAPALTRVGAVCWKRLAATPDSPACIVLDGPNPDIPDDPEKFVPHGFMTLEFDGPTLTEHVYLAHGEEILSIRIP
jgi:hypothetical protein